MRLPQLGDAMAPQASAEIASRADAPALSRLLSAAFEQPWDERWVAEHLFDDESVVETHVVHRGDEIVATASVRLLPGQFPGAGYVHFVATAPEARGGGLGVRMTSAVLHSFATMGLSQAVLETDDDRLSAISLYLGLGFVPEYRDHQHLLRWSRVFRALRGRPSQREASR